LDRLLIFTYFKDRMNSSSLNLVNSASEDSGSQYDNPKTTGELSFFRAPKVVRRPQENGSYFAEWFKITDPNDPIEEDQLYWPSGQALSADRFPEDDNLDDYLGIGSVSSGSVYRYDDSEDEFALADPPFVGKITRQESALSDWDSMPPPLPPLEVEEAPWDVSDSELAPVPLVESCSSTSDWSQMPELLPPIPQAPAKRELELALQPVPPERQISDWNEMPAPLPPLLPIEQGVSEYARGEMPAFDIPALYPALPTEQGVSEYARGEMPALDIPALYPALPTESTSIHEIHRPSQWQLVTNQVPKMKFPQTSWSNDSISDSHPVTEVFPEEDKQILAPSYNGMTQAVVPYNNGMNAAVMPYQQFYQPAQFQNVYPPQIVWPQGQTCGVPTILNEFFFYYTGPYLSMMRKTPAGWLIVEQNQQYYLVLKHDVMHYHVKSGSLCPGYSVTSYPVSHEWVKGFSSSPFQAETELVS